MNPTLAGIRGKAMSEQVRVWQIGPDGTEYYAAHSEEEMKSYYRDLCGSEEYCEDNLKNYLEEVTDLDREFQFNDDGKITKTSWRKLAEEAQLPTQLSSSYC
jgi:hypothetical protein